MHQRRWTARDDIAATWTSRIVALAATIAMFVVAFVAMTTMRSFRVNRARDDVAVIRLAPPVARPEAPKVKRPPPPKATQVPVAPVAPSTVPERIPPADTSAGASPVASPGAPTRSGVASDSGAPGTVGRATLRGGAPMGGVTAGIVARSGSVPTQSNEAIAAGRMGDILAAARSRGLTADELRELKAKREPGLAPNIRAARLPGEPVYAPLMSGGYAVGIGLVSIPVGKTHEKEKAAEAKIDSEYRRRLAGFQLLIQRRRQDSVRADSLLRDSLRRLIRP